MKKISVKRIEDAFEDSGLGYIEISFCCNTNCFEVSTKVGLITVSDTTDEHTQMVTVNWSETCIMLDEFDKITLPVWGLKKLIRSIYESSILHGLENITEDGVLS